MAQLIGNPITPTFDRDHLRAIHRHLFRDVYEWAGEPRRTEISKSNILFLPYRCIDQALAEIFSELHEENLLRGLQVVDFARRAAYYLGRLNMVHPFREGNGRAQRILLDQLAELSSYAFLWTAVSSEQMALACRSARQRQPDYTRLERLLTLHIVDLR